MKIAIVSVLPLLLAVSPVSPRAAVAAGPVATVSAQRIALESTVGKASRARVQALQQERADDVRTKQQALEAIRRQLAQAGDASQRPSLQAQEQTQRAELERAAVKAQMDVQALDRQINAELLGKVRQAVGDVIKGRNIQVVLNADSAVIWAAPDLDLTADVIQRLNSPAAPKD
jgi:Skp family chaperone for outer membrane proteins